MRHSQALAIVGALGACGREPAPVTAPAPVPPASNPSPSRDRVALREVLSPTARRALDEATVTLLVPDDPALLATATITAGPQWVAMTIARGDHTISVHAARARGGDAGARSDRIRGRAATVTFTDGVRAASWDERGVTYALGLACARDDDPRCVRDRNLRELANALVPLDPTR